MIILEIIGLGAAAYGAWIGYKWWKGGKKKVDFTPWNDDDKSGA